MGLINIFKNSIYCANSRVPLVSATPPAGRAGQSERRDAVKYVFEFCEQML